MATQLAPTPVIRGKEAIRVYNEAQRSSSKKSEAGAQKLSLTFEKMMKNDEPKN